MQRSTATRWLAAVGLIGVSVFAPAILALHVIQPELSPLQEAVSYYVHGRRGWLLTLGLLSLGIGSLALAIALGVQKARSRTGLVLLATWSVGVIVGGIFTADPPGSWDQPPSAAGTIHGIAAMIAFAALPAAAVTLTRSFGQDARWLPLRGTLNLLSAAVVSSYVVFMASLTPVFVRPGPPILLGLTERIFIVASLAWLTTVAIGLFRLDQVADAAP
ncbi:MAG TPA: DUF998 domain-containing protein [Lacipirellulaceae bacterium]|nr:DUF998 domain-containing protein [Lacipirellulaceae bacterium]